MIIVLGHVDVSPAEVDQFSRDLKEIDPSAITASGCLLYAVTQAETGTGRILVAERWNDQRSLTAHLRRKEVIAFGEKWSGRLRSEVLKYDASNERGLLD